jgi:prepilin peptidase CpaA
MYESLQTALLLVFPGLAIAAALSDVTSMTIPNWMSGLLVLAFFPAALAAHAPLATVGLGCALGAVALAAGAGLFALRWIGGGDAKLLAASLMWMGVPGAGPFLLWTAVAGGVFGLGLLGLRRMTAESGFPLRSPAWVERLLQPAGDIPYGVAICFGALAAFPQSALIAAAHFA